MRASRDNGRRIVCPPFPGRFRSVPNEIHADCDHSQEKKQSGIGEHAQAAAALEQIAVAMWKKADECVCTQDKIRKRRGSLDNEVADQQSDR